MKLASHHEQLERQAYPAGPRGKLLVVTRQLGVPSEVWLWRQIRAFKIFQPEVITWDYQNRPNFPLGEIPVHELAQDPAPWDNPGWSRWGYRLRVLPQGNFYATAGAEKPALTRILQASQPEVILAHFGFMALKMLPLGRERNIPVVCHFHGLDLSSGLRNKFYRWSLLRNLRHFAAVVVVGSHQRLWLLGQGVPAEKIHLIPCGIPEEYFESAEAKPAAPHFISVCRLVENKGLEYAIGALARILPDLPEARYTIVGDGPLRPQLGVLVRELNLVGKVNFAGAQPPERVRQFLRQANIFVQPSIETSRGEREGFGIAITEALAGGLPVLSTWCGGIPDQVLDGKNGFLVPQRDIEILAQRMAQLAGDPVLRQRLGEFGRQFARDHFLLDRQIGLLEEVLQACVRQARSSR